MDLGSVAIKEAWIRSRCFRTAEPRQGDLRSVHKPAGGETSRTDLWSSGGSIQMVDPRTAGPEISNEITAPSWSAGLAAQAASRQAFKLAESHASKSSGRQA